MPNDDLNLRIARTKGWTNFDHPDGLPSYGQPPTGPYARLPAFDSDPSASAGLEEEIVNAGHMLTTVSAVNGVMAFTNDNGLENPPRNIHAKKYPTRPVAVARVWLAVFEEKGQDHAP